MVDLSWCKTQKNGIELIEPSDNLKESYFKASQRSILAMQRVGPDLNDWYITTAYYGCYHAFYALCMQVGIKSEIHDCTLKLLSYFPFTAAEIKFITNLKKDRLDTQYYLLERPLPKVPTVNAFASKCRQISTSLTPDMIQKILEKVKND